MTTKLAKVTGLALLAASFAFSGSLADADTEDTNIQILTFDAVGNPGEIVAALDCDTGDGMGNCPVETLVTADTVATTVADVFDPAVLEATAESTADAAEPMIRSVEAIMADDNQTEVIVVTGDTDTKIEEPAQTAAIAAPSAEPADITTSAKSVSQPNEEKAGQAAAAIVLEVTQPETVAVAGEAVGDPVVTDLIGGVADLDGRRQERRLGLLNVALEYCRFGHQPRLARGTFVYTDAPSLMLSGERQMCAIKNRLSQKKDKPGERCEATQKDKPVASVETKKSTVCRNRNEP